MSLIKRLLRKQGDRTHLSGPMGGQEPRREPVFGNAKAKVRGMMDRKNTEGRASTGYMHRDLKHRTPVYDTTGMNKTAFPRKVTDMKGVKGALMDGNGNDTLKGLYELGSSGVPEEILNWYIVQSFIGYQTMALIAQNWLVNKACRVPVLDATRNGFEITNEEGKELEIAQMAAIREGNRRYKVQDNMIDAVYRNNIFGIRHIMFKYKGANYEKPYNPDAVKEGDYEGMVQIDPYWITPLLSAEGVGDATNMDFYVPEYWMVAGNRIHKSHFVILTGPEVGDIIKPAYLYGGISLVQRIYERVYAAEQTANEGPMLAHSKRIITYKVDMGQAIANQDEFSRNAAEWTTLRNNYGVMFHGLDEEIDQHDTSLTDIDGVIMTQYLIVAAIANMPVTRLMNESPKGFQSSGEGEEKQYHEGLETMQKDVLNRVIRRHTEMMMRSDPKVEEHDFEIAWNPTNVPSTKERSDSNYTNANASVLLRTTGAVSAEDVRETLAKDPTSPYNGIDAKDIPEGGYPVSVAPEGEENGGSAKDQPSKSSSTPGAPKNNQSKKTAKKSR